MSEDYPLGVEAKDIAYLFLWSVSTVCQDLRGMTDGHHQERSLWLNLTEGGAYLGSFLVTSEGYHPNRGSQIYFSNMGVGIIGDIMKILRGNIEMYNNLLWAVMGYYGILRVIIIPLIPF